MTPTTWEHKGFFIERTESTQLGYRLGEGMKSRPGKGRKETRFYVYSPEDTKRAIKTVGSLQAARDYIDQYVGS
jgi:hypothetical protein